MIPEPYFYCIEESVHGIGAAATTDCTCCHLKEDISELVPCQKGNAKKRKLFAGELFSGILSL